MCIAPAMIPLIYGADAQVKLTIGNDAATADTIASIGAVHENCAVDDIVIDNTHKVVTTPAYMLASNLVEADAGIAKLVNAVLAMTK